jgi:hypothetical protein
VNNFKKKLGATSNEPTTKSDVQQVSDQDVNPRTSKADRAIGDAGVDTPWQASHQITKKGGPHWQAHHQNSQGLNGQTTWEHKGAERGNKEGPKQRMNPYGQPVNSSDESLKELNQSY